MKWIIAGFVGLCLLSPVGARSSYADEIPPGPPIPSPKSKVQRKTESIPLYSVAAGVAAVAMTGSLVGLRVIRKRNGKLPD
jgi:hypothetical protein